MRTTSIIGKGTGKLGGAVYSVSGGVQIVREYNPNVANPNTTKQVNQRARLKLASQIAAAFANVIVIPKQGLKSSRNLFIKKNMDYITAGNGEAQVSYENLQLTAGNAGLPAVSVTRDASNNITCKLQDNAAAAVSRVVYVAYKKSSEGQFQYVGSVVATAAGTDGDFQGIIANASGEIAVYAYGVKDRNAAATAKYGNYDVANGEDIATLVTNRSLSSGDYTFTETRGTTLFEGESETIEAGDGQVMIYITAQGPGTVAGTGFTGNRKAVTIGDSVTVTATPNAGCVFVAWRLNGSSSNLSTNAAYTFTASNLTDLVAIFNDPNSPNGDEPDMG